MNTKKLIYGLLFAGLVIVFSSCEDFMNQFGISLNSDVYEIERTVDPQPAGTYEYIESAIVSAIEALVEENGHTLEEMESVNVNRVTLEIIDEGKTFEAFESFEFVLSSNEVDEVVVAFIDDIPDTANFLNLNISSIDVMNYVTSETFNIKLISVQDKEILEPLNILGKVSFSLNLGLAEENELNF